MIKYVTAAVALLLAAADAHTGDFPDSRFNVALAVGNFDVDTNNSNDPHLNELSYTLQLGFQYNRYLALDLEWMHIEKDRGFDDFGDLTTFGAQSLGASARLQWPLADDFSIYLRGGAARFDLDDQSVLRDQPLDADGTQPMLGAGVNGDWWYVEYVNFGEIEDLHLEQIRAGLILRF